MKIQINNEYYIDCNATCFTLIKDKGTTNEKGEAMTSNEGYFTSLGSALKRAFFITKISRKTIEVDEVESYLKKSVDTFIEKIDFEDALNENEELREKVRELELKLKGVEINGKKDNSCTCI